ncbi:hypothetical protein HHI36_011593 [Cryptolaemus montrouzieri]|uniref:Major facilitator superfamily (MFS) profile domain-containing protein n=1 Tax=Cryptolaemus montrouzieri TaxID=559131 RepID=A0ABD2MMJ4_9CUCU
MKISTPKMFDGSGPQLLAVLAGTINAISDGMQYGWTAPSVPILKSANSTIEITHTEEVWLELFYMLGSFLGLPFSINLVDLIGRKMTVWISSFIGIFGWICIGAGNHIYFLYAGRLLLGITADIVFTASPVYISEIAHQNIRGFLAGLIYLMMLFGIVIIYAIGPWIPIYASACVGGFLLSLQIFILPFMPESPYYLIYANQYDKAEKALRRLRNENNITKELDEIQKAVKRQMSERGRPQDLFLIESNRKASLIMILLNFTQHFSGISVLIMNVHSILNQAGSNVIRPEVSAIVFPCLMLVSATVATLIIDDCGRKILLEISGILTTLSLLVIAAFFHIKFLNISTEHMCWVPLLAIMVYAVAMKFGLGIVPIVITAELFPTKVKGLGMALADFIYISSSMLSIYCYQWLNRKFDICVSFYLFGFLCAICTILISFYVPETKGKTLEEIQMSLKNQSVHINMVTEDTKL